MPDFTSKGIIQTALRATAAGTSSKEIASRLSCSIALVNAWRSGQRVPSSEHTHKLAKYLFPRDSVNQRWLEQSLHDVSNPDRKGILEELDRSNRTLKVGSSSRAVLGRPGFLDKFMVRFFQLSGIKHQFVESGELLDLKEQLVQDELDVGVGSFATLDRSLLIKFFHTPIRVGLNAVLLDDTLRRTRTDINALRTLLAPETLGPASNDIVPIVIRSDVGGIYAVKTLGFKDSDLDVAMNRHYVSYGRELIKREDQYAHTGVSTTPVVLVDDMAALYILRYLDTKGKRARLVFPISTEGSAALEKKWMPEYLVSISVKRTNVELAEYLLDAFRLFLRTEVQMISSFYNDVCAQFEELATELAIADRSWDTDVSKPKPIHADPEMTNRAYARAWVDYTFGMTTAQLDVHQDIELPWKPILQNARKMITNRRSDHDASATASSTP